MSQSLKLLFSRVGAFVIFDFGPSSESFATSAAHERLVAGVNDFVDVQIVWRSKLLVTHLAFVLFDAGVCAFVLHQILIAEERFVAFAALEWPLAVVVDLHVSGQRVFGCEIFHTMRTFVWPIAGVHVHVLVE